MTATSVLNIRRVLRPAKGLSPEFQLAYVRSGPPTIQPIVVIPGGPGLGSVVPYRSLRRLASRGGLDLIMVEHRGVGFSRNDTYGDPLTHNAMWVTDVVDDIAAVLDREGVTKAFIAGSSYGSYLAATFGARHPDRVAGMLLDSALQSTHDLLLERELIRKLFWDADSKIAEAVRWLRESGQIAENNLLDTVRAGYELGGERLLEPLLARQLNHQHSPTWAALQAYAIRDESIARIPFFYEFGTAGAIGFRELNYGAELDGIPLDPARTYAPLTTQFPAFDREPYQLPLETPKFNWPLAVLIGSRDIRTPGQIARRVAATAQHATVVEIENGHSALDTHPVAFLNAVRQLVAGNETRLPSMANKLSQLPLRGLTAKLPAILQGALAAESILLPGSHPQ